MRVGKKSESFPEFCNGQSGDFAADAFVAVSILCDTAFGIAKPNWPDILVSFPDCVSNIQKVQHENQSKFRESERENTNNFIPSHNVVRILHSFYLIFFSLLSFSFNNLFRKFVISVCIIFFSLLIHPNPLCMIMMHN